MAKVKPYEILPLIYPHLMVKIRYDRWASYLHELVKNECPKRSMVLELGAGDGTFARYFTKYFPHIIVTDISHQMLNSKMNSLPRVCCNMLAIPFKTKFDLIYSNFDSVNYLLSGKLLVRLFNEVALNLNEGGVFTFDISLEKNSYVHVKRNNKEGRYKGVSYKQTSTYNPDRGIHTNKFRIKLANGDEYSEIHREKIYSFDTYFKLIEKTDLYVAECYETFSFKPGSKDSNRIQFMLKKKNYAEL
jgi:SAM-dependent methyltransferase